MCGAGTKLFMQYRCVLVPVVRIQFMCSLWRHFLNHVVSRLFSEGILLKTLTEKKALFALYKL